MGEEWARLDHGERIYDPDKDFSHNSAITLTFDLETWFKVGEVWARLSQGERRYASDK